MATVKTALSTAKQDIASKMGVVQTVKDSKVCEACRGKAGMEGQTPPFHPNCRCKIVGNQVFNEAGVPMRSYAQGRYSAEGVRLGD